MTSLAGIGGARLRWWLGALVTLAVLVAGAGAAWGQSAPEQALEEAREERERAEGEEAAARRAVEAAAARKAELEHEREQARARLQELEDAFVGAAAAYDDARNELAATEAAGERLGREVAGVARAVADREQRVGHLLRGLYMRGGGIATYEAVLRTEAVAETTRRLGYLRGAQQHQRELLQAYGAEQEILRRREAELREVRRRQAAQAAELEERRGDLAAQLDRQEDEVEALRGTVSAAEEELAALDEVLADSSRQVASSRERESTAEAELAEERRRAEEERRRAEEAAAAERRRTAQAARASRPAGETGTQSAAGSPPAEDPEPQPAERTPDIACPVGTPRTYSDTYGAPRSGGRSHQGTDILAPRGTPIYAYEAGTVSRMSSNRLGGITLYLQGDSGTRFYYAHLQGYVSGLSTGQRVRAGQQVGYNGDTGNATGIPHLHIEVFPQGGGNVNPYPYMYRACG